LTKTGVGVEKGTKAVISASTANEHSITYERILLLKFRERSFSTATGDVASLRLYFAFLKVNDCKRDVTRIDPSGYFDGHL